MDLRLIHIDSKIDINNLFDTIMLFNPMYLEIIPFKEYFDQNCEDITVFFNGMDFCYNDLLELMSHDNIFTIYSQGLDESSNVIILDLLDDYVYLQVLNMMNDKILN